MKCDLRKIIYIIVFYFVFKLDNNGFANITEKEKDPIDTAFSKCIDNSESITINMTNCIYKAYDDWDKALNTVYKQLLANKKLKNKKEIIKAQRAWIKFRDAEFELLDELYSHLQGTMWQPARANDRVQIIKKRTQDLRIHLILIEDENNCFE